MHGETHIDPIWRHQAVQVSQGGRWLGNYTHSPGGEGNVYVAREEAGVRHTNFSYNSVPGAPTVTVFQESRVGVMHW